MTISLIFALTVISFLSLVLLVVLLMWHSYKQPHMIGGMLVMVLMITAFLTIVYFTEKKSAAETEKKKDAQDKPAESQVFSGFRSVD